MSQQSYARPSHGCVMWEGDRSIGLGVWRATESAGEMLALYSDRVHSGSPPEPRDVWARALVHPLGTSATRFDGVECARFEASSEHQFVTLLDRGGEGPFTLVVPAQISDDAALAMFRDARSLQEPAARVLIGRRKERTQELRPVLHDFALRRVEWVYLLGLCEGPVTIFLSTDERLAERVCDEAGRGRFLRVWDRW